MDNDWKCPNCGGINPSSRLTCLGCNTNKPNVTAKTTIDNYKNIKASGIRNILFGAFWFFGGIIATIYSYSSALSGGTYIIAWGAIIFGGIQLLRGLSQYSSTPSDTQKRQMTKNITMTPININPQANRVKKCPFCAEEIKYEAIVCRYCGRELPKQKDAEIMSNIKDTGYPLPKDKITEQEKANMKPHIILIVIIISLIVLSIIIPISLGMFNSTPHPTPSPTKDFTLIYEMRMFPPTINTMALPTITMNPSATKSYFESSCVLWSTITIYDVGKTICVYGNIYNIYHDNIAYYFSFSNKVNSFYLISYDIYYPNLRVGDCVFTTGEIKRLDNSPVMTMHSSDHLYVCS